MTSRGYREEAAVLESTLYFSTVVFEQIGSVIDPRSLIGAVMRTTPKTELWKEWGSRI